jgi:hypothetical protein
MEYQAGRDAHIPPNKYITTDAALPLLFKALTPEQTGDFRRWARDNYKPGADIKPVWHPAVQDECRLINTETDNGGNE